MSAIHYRPDVDGLRAIAVLSVLFCHAGFGFASGGYVGVDVFFVISGFLITSIILSELKAGTFSLAGFWERRIRRILPPAVLVMIVTILAGYFLYLPFDYKGIGGQVMAQSTFVSNIFFKKQVGYFDTANDIKPLLHTWSLSVEEQFYLFFPLACFFIWRKWPDKAGQFLWLAVVISFLGAVLMMERSQKSAFYLLPFRAWELLVGSLLAFYPLGRWLKGWKAEVAAIIGIVSIGACVHFYSPETYFPGPAALLPCLGAAALIASNTERLTVIGRVLSTKAMVFIGLISYALYLWHWPIMAFMRYWPFITFTPFMGSLAIGIAFILAVLTWHFIEKPFRRKLYFKAQRSVYTAAFIVTLALFSVGAFIFYSGGVPQRLDPSVVRYASAATDTNPYRDACGKPALQRFETGDICQANADSGLKPTFILWGDSYADMMVVAFQELAQKYHKNGYIVTSHGCPPILGYNQKAVRDFDCAALNDAVLKFIQQHNIQTIFIAGSWSTWMRSDNALFKDESWYASYKSKYDDITTAALKRTTDALQKTQNLRVVMMGDIPSTPYNPPYYLAMQSLYGDGEVKKDFSIDGYLAKRRDGFQRFVDMNEKSGIVFVDPKDKLCSQKVCFSAAEGNSLYYNDGHLSNAGARYISDLFVPYFKK